MARPDAVAVLGDEACVRSLQRYFDVFQERKKAKFLISKKLEASFHEDDSLNDLWKEHNGLIGEYCELEAQIDSGEVDFASLPDAERSYLDLKAAIAKRILESCVLCERRCEVNRLEGEIGYCRCGLDIRVSTMFTHVGEEAALVPSFTIFTCGCNLTCVHCQNWSISQWYEFGEAMSSEGLAKLIDKARDAGNRNANLVGGEPTPWLWQWLEVFRRVKRNVPIVWNSNSYYTEETAKLLIGFADVYLNDAKYGCNSCAKRVSNAPRYWDFCRRNLGMARKYGEPLIRVLVLPCHLECCTKPILNWIAQTLGPMTRVNVMWQYRPEYEAHRVPELRRRLTREERQRTIELAREAGLLSLEPFH